MKILKRKTFYKNKYVDLIKKEVLDRNGKKHTWWCVKEDGAVVIFAMTKEKEVILEKNWRVPLEEFVLELPAGRLDKNGENKKEAAKRELREETGYSAKKMISVFSFPLDPSFLIQETQLFFAPDVVFSGKNNLGNMEEIEIIKVPVNKLTDFLLKLPKKTKVDIKIFSAIQILKEKGMI